MMKENAATVNKPHTNTASFSSSDEQEVLFTSICSSSSNNNHINNRRRDFSAAAEDECLLLKNEPNSFEKRYKKKKKKRLSPADVTCLTIMGFVASFLLIYQPQLRSTSLSTTSVGRIFKTPSALDLQQTGSYKYMTYDQLSENARRNGYQVKYTSRGFEIDGQGTLLLGGSIHYPRSTPEMWDDLLLKARHDGLNHIEIYIFWNYHEKTRGTFDFEGSGNITRFYELAAKNGLFLNVRFGPYICAEWSNGGLPVWLNHIPGMKVRSSSLVWKQEMERFVRFMLDLSRPFLAENGGPIILAQIENEYSMDDDPYIEWCGKLVDQLNTTIPWMMCNGKAASNTILACNGNDCYRFAVNETRDRPNEPLLWTENEGWFQKWAENPDEEPPQNIDMTPNDNRTAQDVAYSVARWFAIGGAHQNYYMYHGGNNYGRGAAAGVTTKYADTANLYSDGLSNEPKRSHLRKLHETLISINHILLSHERQLHHAISLDKDKKGIQRAFLYGDKNNHESVVFLENTALKTIQVSFDNQNYTLAAQSMVILKNTEILFNTSDVTRSFPHQHRRTYSTLLNKSTLHWEYWQEPINNTFDSMSYHSFARKKVTANSPMEQLLLTNDLTDYLLYETTFQLDNEEDEENWNEELFLTITSCDANGLIVFLDGKFVAEKSLGFPGGNCTRQFQFQLPSSSSSPSLFVQEHKSKKKHFLQVMSVQLGIFCLDSNHTKGITGKIELNGKKNLAKNHVWNMYPGLVGEQLEIFKPIWKQSVPWKKVIIDNKNNKNISTKFTWFATSFKKSDFYIDAFKKTGDKKYHRVEQVFSILLDAFGMTRGRAFLNGHDLGRIWLEKNAKGEFIQRYYHLPMDWLEEKKENFLVVFDELGGTIEHVRLVLSHMIEQPLSSSILIPLEEEKEISSHIFLTDE